MKLKKLTRFFVVLCLISLGMLALSSSTLAAMDARQGFFQFGIGYYMPAVDGWDKVYDGGIMPIRLGYFYTINDLLAIDIAGGFYSASGKTVEGPGYSSESTSFMMLPLTISLTARREFGKFIPYGGISAGYVFYKEETNFYDYSGTTWIASLKGGSFYSMSEKFSLFAELFYHHIPGESDEKSLSEGDPNFGGPGVMLGISLKNTKKTR